MPDNTKHTKKFYTLCIQYSFRDVSILPGELRVVKFQEIPGILYTPTEPTRSPWTVREISGNHHSMPQHDIMHADYYGDIRANSGQLLLSCAAG